MHARHWGHRELRKQLLEVSSYLAPCWFCGWVAHSRQLLSFWGSVLPVSPISVSGILVTTARLHGSSGVRPRLAGLHGQHLSLSSLPPTPGPQKLFSVLPDFLFLTQVLLLLHPWHILFLHFINSWFIPSFLLIHVTYSIIPSEGQTLFAPHSSTLTAPQTHTSLPDSACVLLQGLLDLDPSSSLEAEADFWSLGSCWTSVNGGVGSSSLCL